jgi:hypothetical protein
MKHTLLVLGLGAFLATPSLAQNSTTSQVISTTEGVSPQADSQGSSDAQGTEGPRGHRHGMLSQEDREKLRAAHDAAMKDNPDLAQEDKDLHDKMDALQKEIDAAMVKADPSVAPLIAKMEEERKHHHGPPGEGGPGEGGPGQGGPGGGDGPPPDGQ